MTLEKLDRGLAIIQWAAVAVAVVCVVGLALLGMLIAIGLLILAAG